MSDAPRRKPGRPAKPADPTLSAADECAAGVMSYASAAALCDVSEMEIRRKVETGDLELIYWGRLPRVLRYQGPFTQPDALVLSGVVSEQQSGGG